MRKEPEKKMFIDKGDMQDLDWDNVLDFEEEFSEQKNYHPGQSVVYKGRTYMAINSTIGPFSPKDWCEIDGTEGAIWEEFNMLL